MLVRKIVKYSGKWYNIIGVLCKEMRGFCCIFPCDPSDITGKGRWLLPMISVVVPLHNMEDYLEQCIASILNQTLSDFELILVDDGSTDESGAICDRMAVQDDRIRVIHRPCGGVSAARNTGLDAACGEYIMQVDADDYVEPELLEILLSLCLEHQLRLAACNHWIERNGKSVPCFSMQDGVQRISARQACDQLLYHQFPDVAVWGKLCHRSLMAEIRYPEGDIYEDTYRIAELLLAAGEMVYTAKPMYHYRIRSGSISRGNLNEAKLTYPTAVAHMNQTILSAFPELEAGTIRRLTHAYLSTRRYLIGCSKERKPLRAELEKHALANAETVIKDSRAPKRDKLALRALNIGSFAYDWLFRLYSLLRD